MSNPLTIRASLHESDLDDEGHLPAEALSTSETDTTLVFAPDGAGRVVARAEGSGGVGGMVPYAIAAGQTFTVPVGYQALFSETIDVDSDGDLVVDGMLIEVD